MAMTWDSERGCICIDGQPVGDQERFGQVGVELESVKDVSAFDWWNFLEGVNESERLTVYIRDGSEEMGVCLAGEGYLELLLATDGPAWEAETVSRTMSMLCKVKGGTLKNVEYVSDFWSFRATFPADGRTTADLFGLQKACTPLFGIPAHRFAGDGADVDTVSDILRAGAGEALVGLCESDWLEVKSQGYDLDSFAGQVELAQDVARFANSEVSAILVLGFRTERRAGVDTITKLALLDLPKNVASRYREVIERRVYPPVEGLSVERVQMGVRAILVIRVPRQPDYARPFLVHGAVVDGKNEGAFISIVRRRGEESVPVTPAEIHALLAAGRASMGKQPQKVVAVWG